MSKADIAIKYKAECDTRRILQLNVSLALYNLSGTGIAIEEKRNKAL